MSGMRRRDLPIALALLLVGPLAAWTVILSGESGAIHGLEGSAVIGLGIALWFGALVSSVGLGLLCRWLLRRTSMSPLAAWALCATVLPGPWLVLWFRTIHRALDSVAGEYAESTVLSATYDVGTVPGVAALLLIGSGVAAGGVWVWRRTRRSPTS